MKLGLVYKERLGGILQPVSDELEFDYGVIQSWSAAEHKDDGTHQPNVGNLIQVPAGANIGGGQVVYVSAGADSRAAGHGFLADNTQSSRSSQAVVIGLATAAAQAGDNVVCRYEGIFDGLAGLTPGRSYYISTSPGSLTSTKPGSNPTLIGLAISTSQLLLTIAKPTTIASASAIAFDAATAGGSTTATSFSYSHTCTGSNGYLLVGVTGDLTPSDVITGVTYAGIAMTLINKVTGSGSVRSTYLFGLAAPATGSHSVVISASASTFIGSLAASYTGVKGSTTPDNSGTGVNASTASFSKSLTPVSDKAMVIGFFKNDVSDPTAGASTTLRAHQATGGMGMCDSGTPVSPAASTTLTLAASGATAWSGHIVSLAPADPNA